jgi:MerR family mercuric resistance operon transcriptional regulator
MTKHSEGCGFSAQRLCKALDADDSESLDRCVERVRWKIDVRRTVLTVVEASLNEMAAGAAT